MRVVGGTARGRRLQAPRSSLTRPTSDKVREAVFSMLESMDAVDGATVLDLFSGSGALGIESLSRGAASAVLVDSSSEAVRAIEANLAVLGPAADLASVVRGDALRYLAGGQSSFVLAPFDLVFADPPYGYDQWPELLAALHPVGRLLVAETGEEWSAGSGWENVKQRRYSGTVVSIVQPTKGAF